MRRSRRPRLFSQYTSGLAKRDVLARGGHIASVGLCQTDYSYSQSQGHSLFWRSAKGVMASTGGRFWCPTRYSRRRLSPLSSVNSFTRILSINRNRCARCIGSNRNTIFHSFLNTQKPNAQVYQRGAYKASPSSKNPAAPLPRRSRGHGP